MSRAALRRQFPDEPWRWKPNWADNAIKDDGRAGTIGLWVFAVLWWLVTVPVLIVVAVDQQRHAWWAYALMACFPLAGVGLIVAAARATRRLIRFGRSTLALDPFPARPGEPLTLAVRVAAPLGPEPTVLATLKCVREYTTGSGERSTTSTKVLWSDERPATIAREFADVERTRIVATFAVPPDAHPTNDANPRDRLLWRLTLTDPTRGGSGYRASFELPLFTSPAVPPSLPPA